MFDKYDYEIFKDFAKIFIKNRKGEIFSVLVDLDDLERVINSKYRWFVNKFAHNNRYYVVATEYIGKINDKIENKTLLLHRFIMNAKLGEYVDHKESEKTLDNRKGNLRVTTNANNLKNRQKLNKNNTSGARNVSRINGWLRVQLQINGKNFMFPEKFEDIDDAKSFARAMRLKYYGEFSGDI